MSPCVRPERDETAGAHTLDAKRVWAPTRQLPSVTMTALAVRPTATCPDCGAAIDNVTVDQPALFYHGGYGANTVTHTRRCRCGYALTHHVATQRPARSTAAA